MIEADGVDAIEICHVVLVGRVVAMPADHVERRVIDPRGPQLALKLAQALKLAVHILKGGDRGKKITRVGQPVGANRTQVRQTEGEAIVLADITAGRLFQ